MSLVMIGRKVRAARWSLWLIVALAGLMLSVRDAEPHAQQAAANPTFSRDIAPILYSSCSICHHSGGHGPFSLMSFEDALKHSTQIVEATRARKMPPWLPERGYGDFAGEHTLTGAQIQLIADWVNAGAPEGLVSEAPEPPRFSGDWQLGPPDTVLEAAQGVSVPSSGPDMFWNFIFSPAINSARYVRAIEIRPGGGSMVVHHANLIVDRMRSARRLEKQPGAGFPEWT